MELVKGRRYFLWYYLIACAIPLAIVGVGLLFPQALGLESVEEWPSLFDKAEQAGIQKRGSALVPYIRASLVQPALWVVNLYAVAPAIAGVIMTIFYFRRRGLVVLASRFRPWRNGVRFSRGLRIWGWLIVSMLAIKLGELGMAYAMGLKLDFALGVDVFSLTFVWYYVSAMFLDQGGLLEETGWRGYASPILQSTMSSPLKVALYLGFFWAVWHLPREAAAGHSSLPAFLYDQFWFFVGTLLLTIIIHYFVNRLGGSVLAAIAVHGLSNDSVGLGGSANWSNPLAPAVHWVPYVVVVGIILWVSGSKLGFREEDRIPVKG